MIGIRSVGWYLPATRHSVERVAADGGLSALALRALGLREKTVPAGDDHPSTMAAHAAAHALQAGGLAAADVDLLIFAGITRDRPAPWVAAFGVLHQLGATRAAGFDLSARCPGIHDALWVAASLIRAGTYRHVLVCVGERFDYLLPPGRPQAQLAEAAYGAGGAAALLTATADNELVAFSHYTHENLALHTQGCPRAGGSLQPVDEPALHEHQHQWCSDLTVAEGAAVSKFLSRADRHNIETVRAAAHFEQIDFITVAPLDLRQQLESLAALGIGPEQTLLTLPTLGHIGPADSLLALAAAVQAQRRVGPRLIMTSRSVTSSNALAIRGRSHDLGIAIAGAGSLGASSPTLA